MQKLLLNIFFIISLFTFPLFAQTEVALETSKGRITLELYTEKVPLATENFIKLVTQGYYDGVSFHRVIKNFMIQSGDPTGTGRGGKSASGVPFPDEIVKGLAFDYPGVLAMANRGPNTNGSQFFITLAPTPWLNGKHTIFGKVKYGMDVVNSIGNVKTDRFDKPIDSVIIKKAYVIQSAVQEEVIKR